jgi:hypothetical protein
MKLHHPVTPLFDYPVLVIRVMLEEGIELVSNLVEADDDQVAVGLPVEAVFAPTMGGWAVPLFRPVRS